LQAPWPHDWQKQGAKGGSCVPASERSCGELHHFIPDARACALRHNRSPDDFGSIVDGINLWWGEKHTGGMLNNLGYVIGLRNIKAGIGWRLDYDDKKGAHINQVHRIPGQKRWDKIYHPIDFGGLKDDSWYPAAFWVKRQWYLWTEMNTDKMPEKISKEMDRLNLQRRSPW
jgi:hypothetical protein